MEKIIYDSSVKLRNKSLEELLQKHNRPEVKCLTMVKIDRILPTSVSYTFQAFWLEICMLKGLIKTEKCNSSLIKLMNRI